MNSIISRKIRKLRKQYKMTQEKFGSEIGVSRRTIMNWEHGRSWMSILDAIKICQKFGCTLDWLTGMKVSEKQVPKAPRHLKPILDFSRNLYTMKGECPSCGEKEIYKSSNYCHKCGQKLNWGEENGKD